MQLLSNLVYWLTIKPRIAKFKKLFPEAEIYPTGSRYVCNPPVMRTDVDLLVYSRDNISVQLMEMGFKLSELKNYIGSNVNNDSDWIFFSWRKGAVNLIVSPSKKFVERHITATHLCKNRNIKDKTERVVVHESLRKNWPITGENCPSMYLADGELKMFLQQFDGPHANTIYMAYRAQHGL